MSYDVIIIGSGPGGYVCAVKAAQLGLKVAVVEKRATYGGTCLNIGCIPSKALLHASELFAHASHGMDSLGIEISGTTLNLPKMMAHKDAVVKSNVDGVAYLFKKNKIDGVTGTGKVLGAGKVEVTSDDGSTQLLEGKNIVIATGSDVAGIPGVNVDIDETVIVSSTARSRWPRCRNIWSWSAGASLGWSLARSGADWVQRSRSSNISTASLAAWMAKSRDSSSACWPNRASSSSSAPR